MAPGTISLLRDSETYFAGGNFAAPQQVFAKESELNGN
jgi:hypothetical protein